jgi:hypothetical protein
MSDKLTLSEAKEQVRENEPSINELIPISDINQNVESWENVDKDKLADSIHMDMGDAWTYGINHPYGDMILELAINRFIDDMVRVPFNHLNPDKFNTRAKAVIEGYWLYDMSKNEVRELVYENHESIDFFHECENEVMQEIESAIIEARLDF